MREFYEGIALSNGLRILPDLRERARRVGREQIAGGATTSCEVTAAGSGAASLVGSSTDSGLMATESGGLRTMGGPFGKRSGWAA